MAIISSRAIRNNKNLSGKAISTRESIADSCTTLNPSTDEKYYVLAERIGVQKSHFSTYLDELVKKGEIAQENGRLYLIRLDDWQLEQIKEKNFSMLVELACVGCVEAAAIVVELIDDKKILSKIVEKYTGKIREMAERKVTDIGTNVTNSGTLNTFLLHYFLFSSYEYRNFSYENGNQQVTNIGTNVTNIGTTYKDLNKHDLKPNKYEEEETLPLPQTPPDKHRKKSTKAADASKNGNHDGEDEKSDIDLRELRPDIPGAKSKKWLEYLSCLDKYKGIDIPKLHEKMLKTCKRKGSAPSRLRFLRWLASEVSSIPIYESDTSSPADVGNQPKSIVSEGVLREKAREILSKRVTKCENDSEIWQKFLHEIGKRLDPLIVQAWFAPIGFEQLDTTRKLLHVRTSEITRDWVSLNYSELIGETLKKIGLDGFGFEFKLPEISAELNDYVEGLETHDRQRFLQIYEEEELKL